MNQDRLWPRVACWCAFAFPALSVGLTIGYSVAGILLFIAALAAYRQWKGVAARDAWPLVAAFLFMSLTWLLDEVRTGRGVGALDRPSKFVLILPCLWFLMRFPPRQTWLWAGIGTGSIVAGLRALFDCYVLYLPRADGQINAIQFGDLSLLLALLSGAGLLFWWPSDRSRLLGAQLALGVSMGALASLLSQSRGGWLALLLLLPVLLYFSWRWLHRRLFVVACVALVCASVVIGVLGGAMLKKRFDEATHAVAQYERQGDAVETSAGDRLALWKAAWIMGRERPILGWAQSGYAAEMKRLVDTGWAPASILKYTHPHNEFLDVFAKRGLLGLAALVAMYWVTLRQFWPHRPEDRQPRQLGLRVAGMLVPLVYAGCGLTQAFLWHNSGTMLYVFMVVLLFGTLSGERLRAA